MRSIARLITTSMRILSFLCACIVASVLRAAAQEPPSFFARGHISTISKNPKMAFATVPSPFEVTVTGCTWTINYPVASRDKAQFAARTVEFDGTNCISRELFSANPWAKGVRNTAAGHVEGGVVPDPNSPMYTGYIWMALCSGCYFKTNSPGRAAPVWTLNPLVQSERYYPAAIWELAGKPPHTPAKITYYLDDTVNFQSPTFAEDLRVIVKEALPPRISDRRLWARLEVTSYISNLDGLDIPKEFECEVFNSVPPGTPSGTQPGRAYSIRCVIEEAGLLAPGAKPAEGRFKMRSSSWTTTEPELEIRRVEFPFNITTSADPLPRQIPTYGSLPKHAQNQWLRTLRPPRSARTVSGFCSSPQYARFRR